MGLEKKLTIGIALADLRKNQTLQQVPTGRFGIKCGESDDRPGLIHPSGTFLNGIFRKFSIELQYTCMQVVHKTEKKIAPGAQKTSWKRPGVYEQLATWTQMIGQALSIILTSGWIQKKSLYLTHKKSPTYFWMNTM